MIQLSSLLFIMSLIFGYIGFTRGWNKEIIATAGIILGLFALFEFDGLLRQTLLLTVPADQVFYVQAFIFAVIVFFSYQTRALIGAEARTARGGGGDGRSDLQTKLLGGIVGFLNGYLVWGSLWYFMHISSYPLRPYITSPVAGTANAEFINNLPLYVLAGGPAGDGNLLSAMMIGLFLIVLIVI